MTQFSTWPIPAERHLQVNYGSVSSGTVTFDLSASSEGLVTLTGAITIAFSNWPPAGTKGEYEIQLVNGGLGVTWAAPINWIVGDGTDSTTFSAMGVTLQTSGTNWVYVWSTDSGITLYGKAG